MNQRLIYLPVLLLSFVMFGVFWWSIIFVSKQNLPYDIVVLSRLLFSYTLYVATIGLATGMSMHAAVRLSAALHILILGPVLILDWLNIWLVAFWNLLDSSKSSSLSPTKIAAVLLIWWVYAAWVAHQSKLSGQQVENIKTSVPVKIAILFILPLITHFLIAFTPVLFMGAGDL